MSFAMMLRGAVCLLVLGNSGIAAESSAEPAREPAPSAEVSIETAKREFKALPSARSLPPESTGLPRMSTPELSLPPSATIAPRDPKAGLDPKTAKGKNWLLDAMEKPKTTGKGAPSKNQSQSRNKDEVGADLPGGQRETGDRVTSLTGTSEERETAKPEVAPINNPLNLYMAGWMTSGDFSLLRPVLDADTKDRSGAFPGVDSRSAVGTEATALRGLGGEFSSQRSPALSGVAPPENPYLQSLALPPANEIATTTNVGASAPTMSPAPVVVLPPTQPNAPEKSKMPDFAKPTDDAKYFKQLKRF